MKGTDDSCSSVAGDSCSSVAGSSVAGDSCSSVAGDSCSSVAGSPVAGSSADDVSVLAALVLAVSNASSDLADDESSSASDDCAFTASFLKTDCVHSIIGPKEDSPDAAAVQSNASNKGEGAGEFFDDGRRLITISIRGKHTRIL